MKPLVSSSMPRRGYRNVLHLANTSTCGTHLANATRWLRSICAFALLLNLTHATCGAQSERYELGRRLQRFELAWQAASPEPRQASAAAMQKAVQSFFGLQLSTAASYLDQAYFTVRASAPSPLERAALAQRVELRPVLLDTQHAAIQDTATRLRLKAFYKVTEQGEGSDALLADCQLQLHLYDMAGVEQVAELLIPVSEARERAPWQLPAVPEGDYWVEATIVSAAEQVSLPRLQLSLVDNLDERLSRLSSWLDELPAAAELSEAMQSLRATVRQTVQTLRGMSKGEPQEIDFPAHRLLTLAERLVAAPAEASEHLRLQAQESAWMVLSNGRRSLPVRVHMPASRSAHAATSESTTPEDQVTKPVHRPILFAFHGAGGSENMFFETYGAGRLIELASQRGWIVVAPRHPLLGMPMNYREMIELLKPFFPIDEQQVFLLGHSMGAGEVVRQMSLELPPPQAEVGIGGGGRSADNAATRATPWWIAAGELDFGRGGARALANRLKQLDCQVEYREYADVEHMVIVQAALDDLFQYLDSQTGPGNQ